MVFIACCRWWCHFCGVFMSIRKLLVYIVNGTSIRRLGEGFSAQSLLMACLSEALNPGFQVLFAVIECLTLCVESLYADGTIWRSRAVRIRQVDSLDHGQAVTPRCNVNVNVPPAHHSTITFNKPCRQAKWPPPQNCRRRTKRIAL